MSKYKIKRSNPPNKKASSWWRRFLESGGGAVLITAVVVGLLAILLTSSIQSRENNNGYKIAAYQEYLNQQGDFFFKTFDLIGNCISASDDLIALTGPNFDLEQYPGVEKQREDIRKTYNNYAVEWRRQQQRLDFAVNYYHGGQPNVVESWRGVQKSVTDYMSCAEAWYMNHNTAPTDLTSACKAEKDGVEKQIENFNANIINARRYLWQVVGDQTPPDSTLDNKVNLENTIK